MSADETLLSNEIFPPGHPKALSQVGDVLLKMIREQDPVGHHLFKGRLPPADKCPRTRSAYAYPVTRTEQPRRPEAIPLARRHTASPSRA